MYRQRSAITTSILATLSLWVGYTNSVRAQDDSAELTAVLQSDAAAFEKAKACQQLAVVGDADAVPVLAAMLTDKSLSNYARYALEAIPDPSAAAAMREAVGRLDGRLLVGVINSIGRGRDGAALNTLTPLLASEDATLASATATAMGRIGNEKAADVLTESLATAKADRIAALADGCLICASALQKDGQRERAVALLDTIREADIPKSLMLAATLQTILIQGEQGTSLLADQLDSDQEARFRLALQAIRQLGGDSAELLESRFDKLPSNRQVVAVLALGDVGGQSVMPTVLKAAGSENSEVRIQALGVLGRRGAASAVPVLLDAATESDEGISAAARAALANLRNDEVDAAIIGMLGSKDNAKLQLAVRLAGERNISSATPQLFALADVSDMTTRLAAIESLGATVSLDDLAKLIAKLATVETDEEKGATREAVRVAAARIPDREACATRLAAAIADSTVEVKVQLLEQLSAVGGTKALETVVAAARSDDDAMQDAATRVLGTWMSPDVAPQLLGLVKTQTAGKYRIRVLRGYIRVARQLNVSHDEALEICRNAMELADRDNERKLVLDVLARLATPEAQALIYRLSKPDEETGFVPIFDGKTLKGWEGNLQMFRVQDGAIVGGSLTEPIPRNEFLCTEKQYGNFELRLQFKLLGEKPNAGVQIRSQRIPDHHEVCGYQADLGDGWWGCLYDESRRRKVLAGPAGADRDRPVKRNHWNDYRILCEGKRIQLWINGVRTVDYTEDDPGIELKGIIGVQVHSGAPMQAWYRNIRIKVL